MLHGCVFTPTFDANLSVCRSANSGTDGEQKPLSAKEQQQRLLWLDACFAAVTNDAGPLRVWKANGGDLSRRLTEDEIVELTARWVDTHPSPLEHSTGPGKCGASQARMLRMVMAHCTFFDVASSAE